jgi:hypothetical protein
LTLTPPVINAAAQVTFCFQCEESKKIVSEILANALCYDPAATVSNRAAD